MEKSLSRNEVHRRAIEFAHRYKNDTYEKGESQTFWNSFLEVFGIDRKRVNAAFEYAAKRSSTGKTGFIDMFWPGVLLVEQKSAGKDLDKAEFQALDYLGGLPEPSLPKALIMSDFKQIRLVRIDGDGRDSYIFDTANLPDEIDRFNFLTSQRDIVIAEEEIANANAVKLMGKLYEQLIHSFGLPDVDSEYDEEDIDLNHEQVQRDHNVSVFLMRLLFLFFGDDTGLWRKDLFTDFVENRTSKDGSDCGAQLTSLFQNLDRPIRRRSPYLDQAIAQFPYVNGGLFSERIDIPDFSSSMRDALIACCHFDWSQISPAIFGSMFQTVKSKKARGAAGEHYTTEENILKVIGPLFLDDLRTKFLECGSDLTRLNRFHRSLGELRFFDPACGCGNFLIIAYRELRSLELDVLRKIAAITGQGVLEIDITRTLRVSPEQFFGIEINEWPARIAETAFFMIDHQANKQLATEFGVAPNRLPISLTATIYHGNALKVEWRSILPPSDNVYILGNPPFLGHDSRTKNQSDELKALWGAKIGRLDYVAGWYKKAIEYYGTENRGKWALVSTNSVTQGEPVPLLFGTVLRAGWKILFAHRTFKWKSEAPGAAAVHCVIVGFTRNPRANVSLFDYETADGNPTLLPARRINAYLVDGPNVLITQRSNPIEPRISPFSYGSRPNDGGGFIIKPNEIHEFMADPVARKYIRKFIGAKEMLNGLDRWCLWLPEVTGADVKQSALLQDRLKKVEKHRRDSDREATRAWANRPHMFDFISQPNVSYLCLPGHTSETRRYLPTQRFEADVIASNAVFTTPDPDGFSFSLVSSSMFMAWQKTVGGRIKSDLRFSNTVVWNNFPVPNPAKSARNEMVAAGEAVLTVRERYPDSTLAELYNPLAMPVDLVNAHIALDRIVDRAFTRTKMRTLADRQRVLFDHYAKRTGQELLLSI
ncbi:DNA methyltransferase [Nocardia beijingensis]|uniref:DNA methyltransferase n=1 Tax=Nocardia beijingensis TaxID=95162 RepID=UPI0033E593DE